MQCTDLFEIQIVSKKESRQGIGRTLERVDDSVSSIAIFFCLCTIWQHVLPFNFSILSISSFRAFVSDSATKTIQNASTDAWRYIMCTMGCLVISKPTIKSLGKVCPMVHLDEKWACSSRSTWEDSKLPSCLSLLTTEIIS